MSGFKFNFITDDDGDGDSASDKNLGLGAGAVICEQSKDRDALIELKREGSDGGGDSGAPCIRPAKKLTFNDDLVQAICKNVYQVETLTVCGAEYVHRVTSDEEVASSALRESVTQDSDIIPLVYEGGLKIWECSLDLVEYLASSDVDFAGANVLELGCGAALPGIHALGQGASVVFQDYNAEVLELVTIPNVVNNTPDDDDDRVAALPGRCQFWAGDWGALERKWKELQLRFDVILTSETIYSEAAQPHLYSLIKAVLKPAGAAYVAAKVHYFGVGGGTRQFVHLVEEDGAFNVTTCFATESGLRREILMMRWKTAGAT
ncbi:PREDICTED: histidine protein methyltransferase 1 homolog [Priapulus caudatus]|uniref:protein-histidine N-methyltransferase n=1 Tax=Priapulus caudatus TaxID=37621 RepID=A0ABM1DZR6_PRICU|nr:PREDICTED: histidine protein methyltransferase 1 homolog [Priapulus caudatus]XP_014665517.1 PREDICTED: histidine protein methyltransferase 1 homolog [Priapulus caudatus]